MLDQPFIPQILKKCLTREATFAELYYESTTDSQISVVDKRVDDVVTGTDSGIGLRIFDNLNTIYGYSNDTSKNSLIDLGTTLTRALKQGTVDKNINLKRQAANAIFPIKKDGLALPLKDKIALCEKASEFAWKQSPLIKQVHIGLSEERRNIEIANSENELVSDCQTQTTFSVSITVKENEETLSLADIICGHTGLEVFDNEPIEPFIDGLVKRTLRLLRARKGPNGKMPVVLSSQAGGTLIHEAVGHALEADLVYEGTSFLANKLNKRIASKLITVVDDATIPTKRGSFAFDDEGVKSEKTTLIENGILKNFMCDRLTAQRMNLRPTGNGRRESYEYRPIVRMTNTILSPGKDNPEDIIKSVDKGVLVTKMGGGQVDTVNGQFIFDAEEAYIIENGQVGEPIKKVSLVGDAPDVLMNIDKVGNDLGFSSGTCGKDDQDVPVTDAIPTIRIPSINVG